MSNSCGKLLVAYVLTEWGSMNRLACLLGLTVFLMGCASNRSSSDVPFTHYNVNINSYATPESATKKRYILVPALTNVSPSDLQFQEFAGTTEKVLKSIGMERTENTNSAQVVLALAYAIGDPQKHTFSLPLPVYGATGIASSHSTGSAHVLGDMAQFSRTTTYTPSRGVIGFQTLPTEFSTYIRAILLTAYDVGAIRVSNKLVEVWRTEITSEGSSQDLRMVFPIMMAGARKYIATNTGRIIKIELKETDPEVVLSGNQQRSAELPESSSDKGRK